MELRDNAVHLGVVPEQEVSAGEARLGAVAAATALSSFYILKCGFVPEHSKSDKKTADFQQNTHAFV